MVGRPVKAAFYQGAADHVGISMKPLWLYQLERQSLGGIRTTRRARLSTAHRKLGLDVGGREPGLGNAPHNWHLVPDPQELLALVRSRPIDEA